MEQPVAQRPGMELSVDQLRLKNFPISFFAMILGMSGFSIAFQKAETILGLPVTVSPYLLFATIGLFAAISVVYLYKLVRFPSDVKHELMHPIKINFFPTVSISLLLFSIAFLPIDHTISRYLWVAGALAHGVLTLAIMSIWMNSTIFQIQHSNPAWFIPVVGNIIVPLAGVEHFSAEISWFFFSIGLVFWVVLFTTFFYRIVFHPPMPQKLMPTLFIMIAPPAVGFIAYVKLMEHAVAGFGVDAFARVLYYFALFLFVMLLTQYRMFARIKFFLSWWAYSFPIAAMTIATTLMYAKTQEPFFNILAFGLLTILTGVIIMLLAKTAGAIREREICVQE
jgi:tellurite resistance protein